MHIIVINTIEKRKSSVTRNVYKKRDTRPDTHVNRSSTLLRPVFSINVAKIRLCRV